LGSDPGGGGGSDDAAVGGAIGRPTEKISLTK
jgi:hypothetical protein